MAGGGEGCFGVQHANPPAERRLALEVVEPRIAAGDQEKEAIADPQAEDEAALWGVISDMDLLHAARVGIATLTARELAATEPVTIAPAASLDEAVRAMEEHDVSHLVVVDASRPVGVLSTLDVAGVLAWGRP